MKATSRNVARIFLAFQLLVVAVVLATGYAMFRGGEIYWGLFASGLGSWMAYHAVTSYSRIAAMLKARDIIDSRTKRDLEA